MAERLQIIPTTEVTPLATATEQVILPGDKLDFSRITIWILTFGQDVTVDLRVQLDTDTPFINGSTGGTASPGTAFVFTTEDIHPGDILVDITAGGTAPDKVRVIAVGWNRTLLI